MCGIVAVLAAEPDERAAAAATGMLRRLAHRGPDDEGCAPLGRVTLAQRRLSILDPTPAGRQPMRSADGRYWIVHNGEIYNFLELADELAAAGHRFTTRTDTEVILASYAAWGIEAFRRFNGIWAVVLWDAAEEQLVLSRDRFGVKPLYVAHGDGLLGVASEIKALLALPGIRAEPEVAAVRDFLANGSVDHSDQTFYRRVMRVPAAHTVVIKRDGTRRAVRYWDEPELGEDASQRGEPRDAARVEEIRALVVDSVALQLRSDVAVGTCLSGGTDSSSVVCVAAGIRDGRLAPGAAAHRERDRHPQKAFFAEFRDPGLDERRHVDRVVTATGIELYAATPTARDLLATLPDVLDHQDEPFGGSSVVAQYHVMRLAATERVKVLLDGQGADEIFGGYTPFSAARYAGLLRRGNVLATLRALAGGHANAPRLLRHALLGPRRVPRWLGGWREPAWLGPALRSVETLWPPRPRRRGTLLSHILWDQLTIGGLPALLRYEDRNSMAFGIEARVPFLDHRLVEAALRLPDRLKIRDGRRKVALVEAMRGIVPDSVLARRDKIQFETPQARWLRETAAAWRPLALDPRAETEGYVRRGAVSAALEAVGAGAGDHRALWRMLNLELWLRRVAGDPPIHLD
jgi:asparagine synthase (glutamine-hydrolysing)